MNAARRRDWHGAVLPTWAHKTRCTYCLTWAVRPLVNTNLQASGLTQHKVCLLQEADVNTAFTDNFLLRTPSAFQQLYSSFLPMAAL
jgi:hypothetical protein